MKKVKVYLAGKVTNNNWREAVYNDKITVVEKGHRSRIKGETIDSDSYDEYYDSEYDAGDFIVTGPHSIGCDHGCYHLGKHAAAEVDWENLKLTKDDVISACCHQIDKSNVLFAYIDSCDCCGTIAEIGYAKAKGKYIFILFKNKRLKKKLWFVDSMANFSCCRFDKKNEDAPIGGCVLLSVEMFKDGKCNYTV